MRLAIQQTTAILTEVAQGLAIPVYQGGSEMIARVPHVTQKELTFKMATLELSEVSKSDPATLYVSELELKRVKRLPKSDTTLQFGTFMLRQPIQENQNDRPFFPLVADAIDEQQGLICHQELLRVNEQQQVIQEILLETFAQLQSLPATIRVTPKMAAMLSRLPNSYRFTLTNKNTYPLSNK